MNEFDELLSEETPPEPENLHAEDVREHLSKGGTYAPEPLDSSPLQEPERSAVADPEPLPAMVRASDLSDVDPDQGDFEPGGLYKGFRILPSHLWPADEWTPSHQLRYPGRFYVESPAGTPGLVPFAGSMVVWPWERAWSQDLNRPQVDSLLKEPEKEKKKR